MTNISFKDLIKDKSNIALLVCIAVILILFIPTLNRPWLAYDERLIFDSIYFPTVNSFGEIFEILESTGLTFNALSSNSIYSSNYIVRSCPFSFVLNLFSSLFFQKSAFLFHLFNLCLHIINTCLFYFILKVCVKKENWHKLQNILLIALFTLIWAVHPVNLESILLTTNYGASLSYIFFFVFILDFLINREKNQTLLRQILIPIVFVIPMLTNEYIIALPFILMIISLSSHLKSNNFKKAFSLASDETKPYFWGLLAYIIYSALYLTTRVVHSTEHNQLIVLVERTFWLVPQIFFHAVKLIFFPKVLTIDQTLFVSLSKTLFSPYAIFCILFSSVWLFVPLYLAIKRKLSPSIFLLTWVFFFSLVPFLHIIAPSYLLFAERYLYCPLALLFFGILIFVQDLQNNKSKIFINSFLSIVLILCFSRSFARSQEWKDNSAFIKSTYEATKDPFIKAAKLHTIASYSNTQEVRNNYSAQIINLLKEAKEQALVKKKKYQKKLPLVLKSYGLDYNTRLENIALLEATTKCVLSNEDYKIGLKILNPYIKEAKISDPRAYELAYNWLVKDKKLDEAKEILLKANAIYPYTPSILISLFDVFEQLDDKEKAEKYLAEALKLYPFDVSILGKASLFYQKNKQDHLAGIYAFKHGILSKSNIAFKQALSNYLAVSDLKNAKKVVSKLSKTATNDPEALYYISKYYFKINKQEDALYSLKTAYVSSKGSNINPKLTFDIGRTLARLYLALGNKEQSVALSKEISAYTGNDFDSLIKLAKLYRDLDLKEELNSCKAKILSLGKGA